jgi:hypothetical protein
MVRSLLLPLLAGLALACQGPPAKTDDDPRVAVTPKLAPPAADPTCVAELLHAKLASFCEFDLGVPPIELPRVAWTAEPYHPLATTVITLDRNGLTDPEGGGTVTIQAWLADPPRRIPEPGSMVFAIAADVPATTVAELFGGLAAAGRQQIRVLVHIADDRPIPQPTNPTMLASMREALPANANERVIFVAKAVQGYAEVCPPVAGVFPQLAALAPGERCPKLAELAATAIVECGCANLDEIMTLLYALTIGLETPSGRSSSVTIALDPEHAVVASEGATWGELGAAQITGAELHLWIAG